MAELMKFEKGEWLNKFLHIRTIIVEVESGETTEEAWERHVAGYPDVHNQRGVIRIFNRRLANQKGE